MEDQQRRGEQPRWTEWEQCYGDFGQVLFLSLGFCVIDCLRCHHHGTPALAVFPFLDSAALLDLRGAVSQTRLAVIGKIFRGLTERAFSQTCALYGPFG